MPNIGACGIDCGGCAAYKATKAKDTAKLTELAKQWGGDKGWTPEQMRCLGCTSTIVQPGCKACGIRTCAQQSGAMVCSRCDSYPCGDLTALWTSYKLEPAAMKANLEKAK